MYSIKEATITLSSRQAFLGLQKIYDHARPRYPQEALHCIVQMLHTITGDERGSLLDVGCGTGILTRQLIKLSPRSDFTGCDINVDMLSQAKVMDQSTAISWHQSCAEELPFGDDAFHMITVAQAAQWFERPKFYGEARRLLKPDGYLVIIENNRQLEDCAFMGAYETLIEMYNTTYSRDYRRFDYAHEMHQAGYRDAKTQCFVWERVMPRDVFVDMAKSSSKVQAAINASEGKFLPELSELICEHWQAGEPVTIKYTTQVFCGHC
ncbi:Demethylmenaquinone methyltransferase [Pseudovibrio axinellae]|uniref:Demethylmenaquinone methyltransferase n=1 Tax=Pseudovibrio axinellae TaxID=989403 RepID=A0A161V0I5_9HYPH|nr:class I SAM-dependent methyltransferase [Pseudovibrio axinellae]KZL09412.1 Demethylmenaquinone methyltransferase [Pseudovibrio axinellae]SEQ65728.1 Ubiquinone/menaquinone biosynthesis C-methylase UbiE [Pseudovibrio axinellae]